MKATAYHELVEKVLALTRHQRLHLLEVLRSEEQQQAVYEAVEARWEHSPECPHCGAGHPLRWGMSAGLQRYRCHHCGKTFNALTGTPLARLRHKERWLDYAQAMIEGETVRASAAHCAIHRNTAFRWRHRFLEAPREQKSRHLSGIAEADETYFLESYKGCKGEFPRPPRKRGSGARSRGLPKEQIPVLIVRDRSGAETDSLLERVDSRTVKQVLAPVLDREAVLVTDGNVVYRNAASELGLTLRAVNLSAGIRVVEHIFHVQNVNAYDSRLKGWMQRFHGVATHYLENYLGWRRWLERFSEHPSAGRLLQSAMGVGSYQQLTVT